MSTTIVAPVQRFEAPAGEGGTGLFTEGPRAARVVFDDATYLIDPEDRHYPAWSGLLDRRSDSRKPVYAETAPAGAGEKKVTRLEVPRVREVAEIEPIPQLRGFGVHLLGSPMPLFLPRDREDLLGVLEASRDAAGEAPAEVLITADPETHEILDARNAPAPGELELFAESPLPQFPAQLTETLTVAQVLAEFEFLAGQGHIPFDYPDDCCSARAHEMYRLLRLRGFRCRKIWNYGGGGVAALSALKHFTLSHPKGFVSWSMHVAPLVRVHVGNAVEDMVLDPAVFGRPARIADWVALQHDSTAVQQIDDPDLFSRSFDGRRPRRDPRFLRAKDWLEDHAEIRDLRRASLQ